MPQFDFTTYSAQIFWFLICFASLYFFLSRIILPRIKSIVEGRRGQVDGDLNFAKSLDKSIDELKAKSDGILKEAGSKQKAALDKVVKESIVTREKSLQEFKEKSEKMIEKSRAEIASLVEKSQDKNKKAAEELTALIEKKFIN